MEIIRIYTLSDPITNKIRYIGKTKSSLKYRLSQHICESINSKKSSLKKNWIKNLLFKDLYPIIEELEIVEQKDCWKEREKYWIAQFKAWEFNITNMTDGGEGNQNQIFSSETLIKKSLSLMGIPRSKEVREKISKGHKGKIIKDSTKEKLRLCNIGKKQSEITKAKRYIPVCLVNSDGLILKEYESIHAAAIANNCRRGQISNVCRKRTKSACGLIWKYKN